MGGKNNKKCTEKKYPERNEFEVFVLPKKFIVVTNFRSNYILIWAFTYSFSLLFLCDKRWSEQCSFGIMLFLYSLCVCMCVFVCFYFGGSVQLNLQNNYLIAFLLYQVLRSYVWRFCFSSFLIVTITIQNFRFVSRFRLQY